MPDLAPATLFQKEGLATGLASVTEFEPLDRTHLKRTKPNGGISITTRDFPAFDSEA